MMKCIELIETLITMKIVCFYLTFIHVYFMSEQNQTYRY